MNTERSRLINESSIMSPGNNESRKNIDKYVDLNEEENKIAREMSFNVQDEDEMMDCYSKTLKDHHQHLINDFTTIET